MEYDNLLNPTNNNNDSDGIILDSAETDAKDEAMKPKVDEEQLSKFRGLRVDDMIKVIGNNKFKGEDGIVKRLKGTQIMVRFYTYGSVYDNWLDPEDLRKMDPEEVLGGLSGSAQPICQREFDNPRGG